MKKYEGLTWAEIRVRDHRVSCGSLIPKAQKRLAELKLADVYDNLRDATTAHARRKLLGKAKRAVELASGDETLRQACRIVRELVEETDGGTG